MELLSRVSLPMKQKLSEEEALKIEESLFSDAIINVIPNKFKILNDLVYAEEFKIHPCWVRQ